MVGHPVRCENRERCSVTVDSDPLAKIIAATGVEADSEVMPAELVNELLVDEYGLAGDLTRINTEKDDTFRLDSDRGRFLVKIAPAAEDMSVVNLQSAAMVHLERHAPDIPAQRLISGVRQQVETPVRGQRGSTRVLRVLSYLEGVLLHEVTASAEQFNLVGAKLARLDVALQGFRHPCESRFFLWNLTHFMHTLPLVDYVDDPTRRDLAYWVYDQFDRLVVPVLADLETQTIHGDFNPFNVLVDPAAPEFVVGIIDFGDVMRSPTLFELSVTAGNLIGVDDVDPWASAAEVVRGYRQIHLVPAEVVELLAITAPARLLLRALVYGWRCVVDPRVRDYALSHSARDWHHLETAVAVGESAIRNTLNAVSPT